jgi:hypothetical protein
VGKHRSREGFVLPRKRELQEASSSKELEAVSFGLLEGSCAERE